MRSWYIIFAQNPEININVMHGAGETEGNLRAMSAFIKNFNTPENPIIQVNLLPEFDEKDKILKQKILPENFKLRDDRKNPDGIIIFQNQEQWVVDFKYMTGCKGTKLASRIEDAYQKSDYAIIMFANDVTLTTRQIIKTIETKITEHPDMKGIFVFDKNENLIWFAEGKI